LRLQKSKAEDVEFVKRRADGGYQKDMLEIDAVLAEHIQEGDMPSMVNERRETASSYPVLWMRERTLIGKNRDRCRLH